MKGDPVTSVIITEPINLSNGGNTVFAPGVNLENFSARYMGTLIPTEDETLTFKVGADDMVRVMVNGDTLVNLWRARQRIQEAQPTLDVKKGVSYRIQIDYVQGGRMAAMQFDVCKRHVPTREHLLAQIGNAETVIFVGGISPRVEGEEMRVSEPGFRGGDRTDIELPQVQRDLLKMLHEAGKKVVFVNCSGGAMAMVPELETCDAIIQGWYGGERGGQAIADVIFGDYNPAGRLPISVPENIGQIPVYYNKKAPIPHNYVEMSGKPLYAFGYGLSYTTFKYSNLNIAQKGKECFEVSFDVTNTGKYDGEEVAQLYLHDEVASTSQPMKQLKHFARVMIKKGETKHICFTLNSEDLSIVNREMKRVVEPGEFKVMVGASSDDIKLTGKLEVRN